MDTTQLKMILDTLKTMGEAGQDALVWWLVLDKGLPTLGWLLTLAGLLLVVRWVIGAVCTFSRIEELREAVGVSYYSDGNKGHARTIERALEIVRSKKSG